MKMSSVKILPFSWCKNSMLIAYVAAFKVQGQGFSTTTPLLDQRDARRRRSKTCQKDPGTRVHRCASSGKHAGADAHACARADNATEMSSMSHKPHPLQQRAADNLAREM